MLTQAKRIGLSCTSTYMRTIHSSAQILDMKRDNKDVPKGFEKFFDPKKDSKQPTQKESPQSEKPTDKEGEGKSEGEKPDQKPDEKPDEKPDKEKPSGQKQKKQKKEDGPDGLAGLGFTELSTLALLTYLGFQLTNDSGKESQVTWQEFRRMYLDRGQVERLVVINRNRVRAMLRAEEGGNNTIFGKPTLTFSIGSVESFEKQLADAQNELGIRPSQRIPVEYREEVSLLSTLLHFAPTLLLIGAFVWMSRKGPGGSGSSGAGGIFGIGKSRAKLYNKETDVKMAFKDVAGCDEAKEEIMEFVKFLKEPEMYERLGAKIPKGAILSGPPGTGKTLLATALASSVLPVPGTPYRITPLGGLMPISS
ncbi:AAA ATPase afg3 [Coemansia sp. RSA 1086]|nr:AAA ATPase afg3 [Coemansia sp. RSA 1086]